MCSDKSQEGKPELFSAESWEYSRNYASLLGEIPSSFSSTIRSLLIDFEKNGNNISSGSKYLATRLVRSANMKASFYYATAFFKPEVIDGAAAISENELVKAYKPNEIATLFGIIYLYKKIKKYCDPAEMAFILPGLHKDINISGLTGLSIRGIGLANGLLAYGMRYVAVATFLRHNIKHFQEFRRLLKNEKTIFNQQKEIEYFGCTVSQIASIFMQTLGFGVTASNNYAMALSNEAPLTSTTPDSSPFKVAELWTRTIIDTGKEPQIIHDSKYYPANGAILNNLLAKAAQPPLQWLDKTAEDINPSQTPKLFAGGAAKAPEAAPAEVSAEVAADLDKIDEI